MLQVHFQLEDGRQTNHYLQVLLSPHIYVSQYCLPLSESHTALGHWAEEKSRLVTWVPRDGDLLCWPVMVRGIQHTLPSGHQRTHCKQECWGGRRGGEEGAGEEESLAFRGFSPTARFTHMQFPLSESLSLTRSTDQEVVRSTVHDAAPARSLPRSDSSRHLPRPRSPESGRTC